jgi:ParB/RepB/Spo0J family partition protein
MTDQAELELQLIEPRKMKTLKAATHTERERIAGHMSAFTVPFGQLRLSTNVRLEADADVLDLAEDIRTNGLLQPIAVRPYGEDAEGGSVFVVETGERRYHALRALRFESHDRVPVHVLDPVAGVDRVVRQHAENAQRKDLTPLDEAETLRQLTELHGLKIRDAAKHLGIDRNTASRRLLLLRLPDEGRRMLAAGEWEEVEGAQLVGRLVRDKAPAELVEQLLGATRHRAQRALDKHTVGRDRDRAVAQLETRGFGIVTNPKNGPAPAGRRTRIGPEIDPEKIKQLDPDDIDTVRDPDGKPIVSVQLFDGVHPTLIINRLELTDTAPKLDAPSADNDAPLGYAIKQAGREAQIGRRSGEVVEWMRGPGPASTDDDDLWAAVMQTLVSRSHFIDLKSVADIAGVEPVLDEHGKVHSEGTARRWYDECDGTECRRICLATVLLIGATHVASLEAGDMPGPSPLHETLFALVPDLSPVADEAGFRALAIAAAIAHDEQLSNESSSDDNDDGDE